jgi:U3 small nucleolar RNA-associated protein 11
MSSTMRNAIQRRNHKERAQPLARDRWGLLEKRKDYKLRAADHKAKRAKLKILREKATNRNPDEFAFGMLSAKTRGGVKIGDRGNKALGHETVLLLKGQDASYIKTMLNKTRRERQKVEEQVGGMEGDGRTRVFVDSVEEQIARGEEPEDEDEEFESEDEDEASKDHKKTLSYRKKLLEALHKREQELIVAERELDHQRAKMNNSIGGVNKKGVKYKIRERKR